MQIPADMSVVDVLGMLKGKLLSSDTGRTRRLPESFSLILLTSTQYTSPALGSVRQMFENESFSEEVRQGYQNVFAIIIPTENKTRRRPSALTPSSLRLGGIEAHWRRNTAGEFVPQSPAAPATASVTQRASDWRQAFREMAASERGNRVPVWERSRLRRSREVNEREEARAAARLGGVRSASVQYPFPKAKEITRH